MEKRTGKKSTLEMLYYLEPYRPEIIFDGHEWKIHLPDWLWVSDENFHLAVKKAYKNVVLLRK